MLKVKINGNEIKEINSVTLALKYDAIASTFSINMKNDVSIDLFRPLSFQKVEIFSDEDKLFTGIVTKTTLDSESNPKGITLVGYSTTGVLMDCEIPLESYPLQSDNKSIKDIITSIIEPFGIELHINENAKDDANKVIEKIVASSSDKCSTYITKIASQYNLIVGHTANGRLLLTRNNTSDKARSEYKQGEGSYIKASIDIDSQKMFSRYTVQRQQSVMGEDIATHSINDDMITVFRPTIKTQSTGGNKNTEDSAKSLRAKGYSAISISVEVIGHRYQDDSAIRPNSIVTLQSSDVFLSEKLRIFVRECTLNSTADGDTAQLNCIIPEALTGEKLNHKWQ